MIDAINNDQIIQNLVYTDEDIKRAKEYMTNSLKTIIYPVATLEELEKLYNDYLAMPKMSRWQSDEMCRNIFKCPNRDMYTILKGKLLRKESEKDTNNTDQDIMISKHRSLPEQFLFSESVNPLDISLLESYQPANFTEEVAKKQAMIVAGFKPNTDHIDMEYPYFTSVEIIANKAAFPDLPDGYKANDMIGYLNYNEWFDGLTAASNGIITEDFKNQTPNWIQEIRSLSYKLSVEEDSNKRLVYERALIELGWNPAIPFTPENRLIASKRFIEASMENKYEVIDLSADLLQEDGGVGLTQPLIKNPLYPVYIVLVEGKTAFSDLVKRTTNGPFSHAGISMDESLSKIYSFNMLGAEGKSGGLSFENVKGYPQKNKLGVFTIFVKQKDIHTMQNILDYYVANKTKTSYSFLNILLLPFKKAVKMDFSMICSEFVDNLLKLCNITLVDKQAPLVTPNDFYRASQKNKKIFKIYEGPVEKYREKAARNKVDRLRRDDRYIKEACILEIKEFPVQFSKEGDLLISNISKINYEEEYSKSHKLLSSYGKNNNIEGMKYELSKLWFLNNLLERDIYNKKNSIANSKCRSRVLNDFNTYINKVLKAEPDFNFTEYYHDTPFSNATIKIKGSTLKYTIDYIKQALMPVV